MSDEEQEKPEKPEDCTCSFPFTEEIAFRHPKSGHMADCPSHLRWLSTQRTPETADRTGTNWRRSTIPWRE